MAALTITGLWMLETHFTNEKKLWGLIAQKARRWLSQLDAKIDVQNALAHVKVELDN